MLGRFLFAIAVFILVGLACLLLGAVLGAVGIPVLAAVGAFLTHWAWAIALAFGLIAFVSGATWASIRARP